MPGKDALDWDDLRYFLEAVRASTLAGAARALGVEHTTIGRRLSALERALGASLVLRAPDGLRLTPLGARILPHVEEVERAVSALRDVLRAEETRVRLAVPSGFTPLFTARLGELRAAYPDLVLEILSGSRPVDLERSEAELAVRSGPIDAGDLVARPLCESGWSLYAAPAYLARRPAPADVEQLAGHELIGYHPSLSPLPAARWVEERAASASVVLRCREMTEMLAAALSGAGLALLPCVLGDDEPGLSRLTPRVLATRSLSLVYRREMRLSAPVSAVIEFVLEVMRANAARVTGAAPTRSVPA
jgi:DNA-binding transcriptional LysR family regulator